MTVWPMLLNDKIPDCGVAACGHAIQLWEGTPPSDDDIQIAQDRFSATESNSKLLWGWVWRGIGGHKLGGYARIRPEQIPDVVKRFGCAFVCYASFQGVPGNHDVLAIPGNILVSWGTELRARDDDSILEAYAIARRWHPILLWWTLRNWGL